MVCFGPGQAKHLPQHQPWVPRVRPALLQLPSRALWVSGDRAVAACPLLPASLLVPLAVEREPILRGDQHYRRRRNTAAALSLPWGQERPFC